MSDFTVILYGLLLRWWILDVIVEKRKDLVAHFWTSRRYAIRPEVERMIGIVQDRFHCIEVLIDPVTRQSTAHVFDLVPWHWIHFPVDDVDRLESLFALRFYFSDG